MYEELKARREDRIMRRFMIGFWVVFVVGVILCMYFGVNLQDYKY